MSKKNSSIKHSRKNAESSDFPAGCVPVDAFKKEFFRRLRRRYKIYVVRAEHAGDYKLNVYFADGTMQTVDFEPFFVQKPHPQYNKYYDPKRFLEFKVENDTVVWGDDWDLMLHPLNLYYNDLFGYYEE